ncbi:MAG: DUF2190 family protein [Gammaproteobacteria bacterium]|jgi:hypothetical protein
MATIYVSREDNDHIRLNNDTGADLSQYEPTVIGELAAVADEAITSAAVGSFAVEAGLEVQSDDLSAGENTFGTVNQIVYFDPSGKTFSDTETVGYYEWGQLKTVKDTNGVIVISKFYRAVLVTS